MISLGKRRLDEDEQNLYPSKKANTEETRITFPSLPSDVLQLIFCRVINETFVPNRRRWLLPMFINKQCSFIFNHIIQTGCLKELWTHLSSNEVDFSTVSSLNTSLMSHKELLLNIFERGNLDILFQMSECNPQEMHSLYLACVRSGSFICSYQSKN